MHDESSDSRGVGIVLGIVGTIISVLFVATKEFLRVLFQAIGEDTRRG